MNLDKFDNGWDQGGWTVDELKDIWEGWESNIGVKERLTMDESQKVEP
jgi:hypothetical protein